MPKFKNKEEYEKWKTEREIEKQQETSNFSEYQEPSGVYNPTPHRSYIKQRSLREEFSGVFTYPFYGEGRYLMIAGTITITILNIFNYYSVSFLKLFSLFANIIVVFYLTAFMFKIIVHSANGEEELPDWPDIYDFFSDLVKPLFYFFVTIIVSFLPFIIYYHFTQETSLTDPILFITVITGILYFPMGLIAVAISNSLMVLSPHVILPSIKRILFNYLIGCLFLISILGFELIGKGIISKIDLPLLTIPIYSFLSLYFIVVKMRILGLIYYTNRHNLGWFQADL